MTRSAATRWPALGLASAMAALVMFGTWMTVRASWVLAHGGNRSLGGAFHYPVWAIVHFAGALVFVAVLPFQLSARLRDARPRMHRVAGRAAACCGLAFSVTGVILPYILPARPFGEKTFMTTFGVLFGSLLWRGVVAARRRDFVAHRAWMLRVTAGALSPVTDRVLFPFIAMAGIDSMARFWDLFMTALWLSTAINLLVVEWWIRRTASPAAASSRFVGVDISRPTVNVARHMGHR